MTFQLGDLVSSVIFAGDLMQLPPVDEDEACSSLD